MRIGERLGRMSPLVEPLPPRICDDDGDDGDDDDDDDDEDDEDDEIGDIDDTELHNPHINIGLTC